MSICFQYQIIPASPSSKSPSADFMRRFFPGTPYTAGFPDDLRILCWLIAAGGILSASLGYFHGKIPLVLMVTGALVGGVFLLISRLTQEAFGYGDSLMIAVTGVYLGFWNVLYLLVWAYVLAAVFAGYVLIRKGFQKDAAFPFVPFLLAAYIGIVCLGGI